MRANLPDKNWFVGKPLPGRPDLVLVEFVASGNDGNLFRAYSNALQRDFACKIVPRTNLVGASDATPRWRAEIEKANALRSAAVVRFVDLQEWSDPENKIDCVAFISDFVAGQNLRDFIARNRHAITLPFILYFLETVFDLFNEMAVLGQMHGDFHTGNILVEDRSYALTGERYAFRFTDFGVANATSDARFKDDYSCSALLSDGLCYRLCGSDGVPAER